MTTNTTNSQAPEILAKQVAEWRKEVARLNDLIAHAEGRDSQVASIDTPELSGLLRALCDGSNPKIFDMKAKEAIIAYIDAKLVQEWLNGFSSCAEAADIIQDKTNCELVKMEARATAAESRLAEIQRGVEGAEGYWRNAPHYDEVGSSEPQKEFFLADDIRALLKPQGQADTSGLPG